MYTVCMSSPTKDFPSVEEFHAFRDKINEGRKIIGQEPIDTFDPTSCMPGMGHACLSAKYLFCVNPNDKSYVGTECAYRQPRVLVAAWDEDDAVGVDDMIAIPEEILKVTNVFDGLACAGSDAMDEFVAAMREAGCA
jgi:hypothetical protein